MVCESMGGGVSESRIHDTQRETQQQPAVTRRAVGTVSTTSPVTNQAPARAEKYPPRHAVKSDVSPHLTYVLLWASRMSTVPAA